MLPSSRLPLLLYPSARVMLNNPGAANELRSDNGERYRRAIVSPRPA